MSDKKKIVSSLVAGHPIGNINFDFTAKSQYFIGKHIRKQYWHHSCSFLPSKFGVFQPLFVFDSQLECQNIILTCRPQHECQNSILTSRLQHECQNNILTSRPQYECLNSICNRFRQIPHI